MDPLFLKTEVGIELDFTLAGHVDLKAIEIETASMRQLLEAGAGPGADYLGWLDWPETISEGLLARVEQAARTIREAEALVVVGIGGSYLGAKAAIDALRLPFEPGFEVLFAGQNLDPDYHTGLLRHLAGKRYAVNVISKSGTTTEPAAALRLLLSDLGSRYGQQELERLVFVTTDEKKGKLRPFADALHLTSFVVPDDIGGRFSVLTPVGLLPIAAAGVDVRALLEGASRMMEIVRSMERHHVEDNPAIAYAAFRNQAYRRGKKIEVMASYTPRLSSFAEWWKQLFGESEGKDRKGIFPASVSLTSDLHSMGQWLQDGERTVFETVLDVKSASALPIPKSSFDDGMGHLNGKSLLEVNRIVTRAAMMAHAEGGVPALRIGLDRLDALTLGALIYLCEYTCGISAYLLGVNPFDQPGVEAYKKNMKALLG